MVKLVKEAVKGLEEGEDKELVPKEVFGSRRRPLMQPLPLHQQLQNTALRRPAVLDIQRHSRLVPKLVKVRR